MRRMAFSYGCVMAYLPEFLAEQIRGYAATIPMELMIRTEDAPTGIPAETHITVKYGLLTQDENEVASVIIGNEPVVVRLGRVGIFHNEDEAVLKIAVESAGLRALHNRVCQLDHVNTYRDYRPHVTVAYLRKKEEDPYYYRAFYSDQFEGTEFEIGQVVFSSAGGKKTVIGFNGEVLPMERGRAARIASRIVSSCG